MEGAMLTSPVAIFDRELLSDKSFTLQTFELCTMCGARFGIGYHGACNTDAETTAETEELPRKLTEILAKDHRQNRAHKHVIELDF
jgi:hypothetical protein